MAPPTNDAQKTKLSKQLLEMKFMQRTKEKVEQEDEDEERRELFDHEITDHMRKGGSKYVIEQSFIHCENLVFGRMSFNGFNPEIEKLMTGSVESENEMEEEVSKEDMAERYSSLVNTMGKKFTKKQNFHGKKSKPRVHNESATNTVNTQADGPKQDMEVSEVHKGAKRKHPSAEGKRWKRAAEFWKPNDEY